jgi:membrane-bound lytic murein transglycosylase A
LALPRGRLPAALAAGLLAVSALASAAQAGSTWSITLSPGDRLIAKPAPPKNRDMPKTSAIMMTPVPFSALPGWEADDHLAAWKAFVASCKPVLDAAKAGDRAGVTPAPPALLDVCQQALAMAKSAKSMTRAAAKAFFESHFRPSSIAQSAGGEGLLTGYYEPLIKGSRIANADYATPVYKRPPDLVNVVAESERGAKSAQFTHMRKTDKGLVPYLTRAEIEQGGLAGQNLELLYFKDPVDVFFMQIQGSGRIELPDGEKVRITYDGKNGYPYTSIGKHLIEAGTFAPESMSLKALASWLKQDRKRAEPVMWENRSYVFFRELKGAEAEGAMGVLGIPLQPGRSLAVDTAFHAIGMPIFVTSSGLTHANTKGAPFQRLMIAHDVGSAIKGAERGDIFFGSGDGAAKIAGVTKHAGHFFVLEPVLAGIVAAASEQRP